MAAIRNVFLIAAAIAFAAGAIHAQSSSDKAAEVNGRPIMTADIDAKIEKDLAKLHEQIFALRRKQLEASIDQRLLDDEAAKRSVTTAALIQSEVNTRVTPVTDEEVAKFYEENKAKLQGDAKVLEPQIRNFLHQQRIQTRQQELLTSLRAAAKVEVFLAPPPFVRVEVKTAGAPMRGPATAPVTIVEFSDFHCPFCRKVQPVLDQLRVKYGDKIRIVFRDLPLDNLHPQARAASEAAGCANDQGKFWEFHDIVFRNGSDASPATLARFAKEAGLDGAVFEACRTSGKYKAAVIASNQEGTKLGITGTPTFFINGRMLVGAQPLDAFSRVIDEELALVASRPSGESR